MEDNTPQVVAMLLHGEVNAYLGAGTVDDEGVFHRMLGGVAKFEVISNHDQTISLKVTGYPFGAFNADSALTLKSVTITHFAVRLGKKWLGLAPTSRPIVLFDGDSICVDYCGTIPIQDVREFIQL